MFSKLLMRRNDKPNQSVNVIWLYYTSSLRPKSNQVKHLCYVDSVYSLRQKMNQIRPRYAKEFAVLPLFYNFTLLFLVSDLANSTLAIRKLEVSFLSFILLQPLNFTISSLGCCIWRRIMGSKFCTNYISNCVNYFNAGSQQHSQQGLATW